MKDRLCNSLKEKDIKKILKEYQEKVKAEEKERRHHRRVVKAEKHRAHVETEHAMQAEEAVKNKAKEEEKTKRSSAFTCVPLKIMDGPNFRQ